MDEEPAAQDAASTARTPQPIHRTRRLGRAAFLGMLGVGGGAIVFGKRAFDAPKAGIIPGTDTAAAFTIYTVTGGYPKFDPAAYRLRIDGMVRRPINLTLDDILRAPHVSETRFYQCVTGWSVPRPTWTGIRLASLLDHVQATAGAHGLVFYSFDGTYTESLTMEQARHADVLLAYKLDHKPLSQAQGAPLRLVVPGMYGYKFIKWVNRVELVPKVIDGYWERNGYDRDAYIGRSNHA